MFTWVEFWPTMVRVEQLISASAMVVRTFYDIEVSCDNELDPVTTHNATTGRGSAVIAYQYKFSGSKDSFHMLNDMVRIDTYA